MKRKICGLLALLFTISLILTGCGSTERVICTKQDGAINTTTVMDFKRGKIIYFWIHFSANLYGFSASEKKELADLFKKTIAEQGYINDFSNSEDRWEGDTFILTADETFENSQMTKDEATNRWLSLWYDC